MNSCAVLAGALISGHCAAAVVIPVEIEGGNPVTVVRINGVDVRLIVDSGGELVSLKSSAIDRVAAARTDQRADGTNVLGQTTPQALLRLDSLEIGGRTFHDVPAQESGAYAADSAGDGVIGRNFLNRFIAVYDYASRRISLFDPGERASVKRECRGAKLRMMPNEEGLIVTRARVDGFDIRVLWDTGAVQSFIKQSFAIEHELPVESPYYTARNLALGGRDVGPLRFVVVDLVAPSSVDGYLGYSFFADHVICIDPRGQQVRFRKS